MRFLKLSLIVAVITALTWVGPAGADPPLITGAQIADDSVTGADVLESSLGSVPQADRATVSTSTESLVGREIVTTVATRSFEAGGENAAVASCPVGKYITGGGGSLQPSSSLALVMIASYPTTSGVADEWQTNWRNITSLPVETQVSVYAICAGG